MNENAKLSEEQMFDCFKSLNVPLRLNDLKTPTKEFVIRVFHIFLRDLQINLESQMLQPFDAIRHLEMPELYEAGQMLILLAFTMNEILRNISPLNITVSDIIAPKPKRTKKIFNYLLIFWNRYYQTSALFQSVLERLQPEIQKSEDLKVENENLEEHLMEYNAKLKNMKPSKDELCQMYESKEEKVKQFEITRKEVIEEYQQLKEKENQLLTQISNMDITIVTTKEKLNELDQLIISSPEKINADVQKVKEMVKDVEQKIQEKELERKEKKKSCQSLVSDQEEFDKNRIRQEKIYNELQLLNETAQNVNALYTKYQEENKNLKELLSTQEMKEVMANVYEQKSAKVQLSKKKQIEEISVTLEMLQRQITDEKDLSAKLLASKTQVEEKADKAADSVIDVVENCKKVKAETERIKSMYASEMRNIDESFYSLCKVAKDAKHIYGFQ